MYPHSGAGIFIPLLQVIALTNTVVALVAMFSAREPSSLARVKTSAKPVLACIQFGQIVPRQARVDRRP